MEPAPVREAGPGYNAPSFDVALKLTREDTLTSPLLPGFALTLAELW